MAENFLFLRGIFFQRGCHNPHTLHGDSPGTNMEKQLQRPEIAELITIIGF